MSATDRSRWGGDAEDDLAVPDEFDAARPGEDELPDRAGDDASDEHLTSPPQEPGRAPAPATSPTSAQRPRPPARRTPPPKRRTGVTRRQWMRRAVAGTLGLSAAGLAGYELHPAGATSKEAITAERRTDVAQAQSAPVNSAEAQSFLTRPDLKPPVVKVTHFATTDTAPAYVLLSVTNVIATDAVQQGLMMIDRQGRLIWFAPISGPDKPFNLNAYSVQGRPALTWWQGKLASSHGEGVGIAVDSGYGQIQRIRAGHGLATDLHELNITSRGTALVTAYQQENADLRPIGGSSSHPVFSGHAQEIELTTGKVLFDWSSLDHVAIAETYMGKPAGSQVLDYFHINSVGETADGNLLISGRNTGALYKVDRHTGAILWRLGGRKSDFSIGPDAGFHWQHDGRAWSESMYTVFDNGANGSESRSRGLLLNVDESARSVSLIQEYLHPAAFVSPALGSVTRLSDGRIFVGWGDQPYFSEFDAGGAMLLDGQLPIGVRSYRAFTVDWLGKPAGKPAIVARENPAGGFVVRASWNGATEIARWEVLGGSNASHLTPVGDQIWTGFETAIAVNSVGPSFQAVALDSTGHELGRSDVV